MKNKKWFILLVLTLVLLSCNLPDSKDEDDPKPSNLTIESVSVDPAVGRGTFSLTVVYSTASEFAPNHIECYYKVPGTLDARKVPIGLVNVPMNEIIFNKSQTFQFTYTEPGRYTAYCEDASHHEDKMKYVGFKVVEQVQPTSTPTLTATLTRTPTPTITPTKTPAITTLVGRIEFEYNQYTSSRIDAGPEVKNVVLPCVLDITIDLDGNIKGERVCTNVVSYRNPPGSGRGSVTTTVFVTGKAVRGGKFIFTYDAVEKVSNGIKPGENLEGVTITGYEYIQHVTLEGEGVFTSPTRAEGTANIDYACTSGASNLNWCFYNWNETFKGSLPWKFAVK